MHARETIVSRSVKVTTVPLRSYKREKKEDCASTWQQKTRKGEKEREEWLEVQKKRKKMGRESVSLGLISVCCGRDHRFVQIHPLIFTSSEYIRERRSSSSITGWTFCWRITWQNSGISVGTGSRADLLSGVALLTSLSLWLTTTAKESSW